MWMLLKMLWGNSEKDNECFGTLKPLYERKQVEVDFEGYGHVDGSSWHSEPEQMSSRVVSCECQPQPINSDTSFWQEKCKTLTWVHAMRGESPQTFPNLSQCCGWTCPYSSCYDCETQLSQKPSGNFEEQDLLFTSPGKYMACPRATQRGDG